jgi:hypothetical protein
MFFKKFILENNIGKNVAFKTDYYKGNGIIAILGDGNPGITTDSSIFEMDDIRKLRVLK